MSPPDSFDAIAVLLRLTSRLGAAGSLEEALNVVTDTALQLLPADHASVRVLDPTHTMLLASARAGRGTEHPQVSLRSGEGVAGWVLESGRSARIEDVLEDARFKPARAQGFAIRSMVAAPLCSGSAVVGVLSASSPRAGAFTARDEEIAQLLANCSVPPLERVRLERLALTDHLTLAFNARYLRPHLERTMSQAVVGSEPSLLFIDLDDFKRVNDRYGHLAGDAVLRGFADRVRRLTRQLDTLVRRGGDEFALVMPAATFDHAAGVADRIRLSVSETPFVVGGVPIVQTISTGVATWNGVESAQDLELRADRALYRAKAAGRDRVEVDAASPPRAPGLDASSGVS